MKPRRIGFATCELYRELAASDRLAAEALRCSGYEVSPIVWTETPPSAIKSDIVVIRSVWDYHLQPERFLDWIDNVAERAVVLNPPEIIHWNADKRYLFDLQREGLAVPDMIVAERGSRLNLTHELEAHGFQTAVVKPVVSASAFQTYLLTPDKISEFQPRIDQLMNSRTLLIQEYIPEITTHGEWSLMFFGGDYSHTVRKLPKAGDFRVQAEHGGEHVSDIPPASVMELAQKAVRHLAADTLYARIDIVEAQSKPLLMEVELIDPELYLTEDRASVQRFAAALAAVGQAAKR